MGFGFGQRRGGELPVELTGFVGRTEEITLIRAELARSRLVTLAGPGGVGKSRTAMRAAAGLPARFPDGVWLAELSGLRDPELLLTSLAAVLELPEQPGMGTLDAMVAHLRERTLLIVLDTCEHLLDACAMVSDVLLREAPGVSVLATSRQPLDVPGERCLTIAPLDPADSLELFVQRAASVVPGFAVTDANREQLLALVGRLDGMPLALELAAVRLRAVPLAELASRLDRRFEVLTGGRRTAHTRHQTLRTAIGWSHELCTPHERLLWARLSVFAGPFDVSAAERVCAGGKLAREDVLPALIGLVDKSVVQRTGEDGDRYRLLDSIREYGADWLARAGDVEAVRERPLAFMREFGQRFWDELLTPAQLGLHAAVRDRIADIRLAMAYAYGTPERARDGLWLAAQLAPYWRAVGTLSEGRHRIDKGLDLAPAVCEQRAWGLLMTGILGIWTADLPTAAERFPLARDAAEQAGTERVSRFADAYLGALTALDGGVEGLAALAALAEARQRTMAARDGLGRGVVHYEEALLRAVLGDTAEALRLCEAGLGYLEGTGDRQLFASTLVVQGAIQWLAGEYETSLEPLHRGLEAASEIGEALIVALACLALSWHAAREERYVRAAWLLGYAENTRRLNGDPVSMLPSLLEEQESVEEAVAEALGAEEFGRWRGRGARLPGAAVLAAVRADADEPPGAAADHAATALPEADGRTAAPALTRREREVAALVAQGLSNREVAERLVISKRTADAHVEHIFAKLGITSRREIPAVLE
ncbi:LuxR C-terminal-related transcriptional regulator [Streptomyces sp. NBC_01808]|uniref:ATP-binding protein n=1 Tax=Streptomyces sp. NBC_01808 TaxID=2975947 RepID=UPI002DDA8794|nr:LuxR C-terminal-related transcriptional regulator [Streptomyces sp. NBC_01808]WSA42122.1 LuxR C-terminal-related transcriptional regulator [Streptomyces sp. NBC_01808]